MNIEHFNASVFIESINAKDFHTPTQKYFQSSDRLVFWGLWYLSGLKLVCNISSQRCP